MVRSSQHEPPTPHCFCLHNCNSAAHKQKVRTLRVEQSNKETQRLKNQLFEELKATVFLSIADTCKLIGISRQTVCQMIERGDLITGKAGRRTLIRRSDIDQLLMKLLTVSGRGILMELFFMRHKWRGIKPLRSFGKLRISSTK